MESSLAEEFETGKAPEADVLGFPPNYFEGKCHISVDVETFDNSSDSALATIGAVACQNISLLTEEKDIPYTFYAAVYDDEGSFDSQTIRWHAEQDGFKENIGAGENIVSLREGLESFASWLGQFGAHEESGAILWSHATFDFPVLKNAYRRAYISVPWHYRNTRDLRTLYELAGERPDLENENAHHALEDAKYQLREVRECYKMLGMVDSGSMTRAKHLPLDDYEEWRDATGVWPESVSRDGEIQSIIEDAVEYGYMAGMNDG